MSSCQIILFKYKNDLKLDNGTFHISWTILINTIIFFLYLGGSKQGKKTILQASAAPVPPDSNVCQTPEDLVFSNPGPSSSSLHDIPGPSSFLRFVTSLSNSTSASLSTSSSSRQRSHRGGQPHDSSRHDLPSVSGNNSKRSNPVPSSGSGGRSGLRGPQHSSGNAVYIQHQQQQQQQQQQAQSHHHHHQGSGINYRILQLKMALGDVTSQLVLLQEINQVRRWTFYYFFVEIELLDRALFPSFSVV